MNLAASKNGFTTTTQEKDYVLGQSGAVETVLTMAQGGAMQWDHSNVYANGELVGAYTQTGLHFYLHDWQGTVRAVTDYAGVVEETCPSLPFGDTLGVQQNSACPQQDSFAGLSGSRQTRLDDAVWRSYSPATGRWMSPDPYNGSYSLTNPQSFDRYAYVGNNPLGFTDPSGLDPITSTFYITTWGCGSCTAAAVNPIAIAVVAGIALVAEVTYALGWWSPPQFHGSLKPRPKVPIHKCPSKFSTFFRQLPVYKSLAQKLNTKTLFLMAQSSYESSWLGPHAQALHNLFGMTRAGGADLNFSSYQASAAAYYKTYATYLSNTPTMNAFIAGLKRVPPHGYNTVNPNYYQDLANQQKYVRRHALECGISIN